MGMGLRVIRYLQRLTTVGDYHQYWSESEMIGVNDVFERNLGTGMCSAGFTSSLFELRLDKGFEGLPCRSQAAV